MPLVSASPSPSLYQTRLPASPPQVSRQPQAAIASPSPDQFERPKRGPVGAGVHPGVPVEAPVTSAAGGRSPARYDAVLDQFQVETNKRYTPSGGKTYCNIFVADATKAMGAPIPTVYDDKTGEPGKLDPKKGWVGGYEHDANGMVDWLRNHGAKKGWKKVSAADAQKAANAGQPAVAAWKNPGGTGHVAMVRPDPNGGPTIAQAGQTNFGSGPVSKGFASAPDKSQIEYWVHD